MKYQPGKLYIVATPIGNSKDITLRALEILREADQIVCEEEREASTLLRKLGIATKPLISLNEHNEQDKAPEIINLLIQGQNIALISDCGTPVFADPGHFLIEQAAQYSIEIIPVPGASSLMATLSVLDFNLQSFHFAGFLPREKSERQQALQALRPIAIPIVLMDTPYRLTKILDEAGKVFGKNRRITLGTNITQDNEKFYRGTIAEVISQVQQKKAEFILVIHARGS